MRKLDSHCSRALTARSTKTLSRTTSVSGAVHISTESAQCSALCVPPLNVFRQYLSCVVFSGGMTREVVSESSLVLYTLFSVYFSRARGIVSLSDRFRHEIVEISRPEVSMARSLCLFLAIFGLLQSASAGATVLTTTGSGRMTSLSRQTRGPTTRSTCVSLRRRIFCFFLLSASPRI